MGLFMIREYIDKLCDENNQTLNNLEKQMRDLLNELSSAEQWSESLQRENNAHTNIFSPRNIDTEIDQKIEKAVDSVSKIKQQIEYLRDLMETHLQKKAEYEKLLSELENSQERVIVPEEKTEISKDEFKKILSALYSKTELCLALLNGDKNRCKRELNNMKQEIKKYAEEIENN